VIITSRIKPCTSSARHLFIYRLSNHPNMFFFAGCSIFLVALLSLWQHLSQRWTPQPIFISEIVPWISHSIRIARQGALYYKRTRYIKTHVHDSISNASTSESTGLHVFGLRLLRQRIYVITDLHLITKIQRHPTISFDPLVLLAAERLCGASKSLLQTMHDETKGGKKTSSSLMHESHVLTRSMLRSRANLISMVGDMLDVVSIELDQARTGDLYSWIRRTVCLASTDAFYGPHNPFRVDPKLENSFW
jgi:hypothetical protein